MVSTVPGPLALTNAERLLYTTVRVDAYRSGQALSTGTAFFWGIKYGDQFVIALITNKHVVQGGTEIRALCHLASPERPEMPNGNFAPCSISFNENDLLTHPEHDLCAFAFGPILTQANERGEPIFHQFISEGMIPSPDQWNSFDAFENVTMIGCPNGLFDMTNNLPIIRRGNTASHIGKRYNGKEEFLIDAACFPGSSGSPVFLYDTNGYFDRTTNSNMLGAQRLLFLGILYAGPQISNSGEIVLSSQPRVEVATMMHLGQVIRSTAMRWFDETILKGLPPINA